ncbi:MAG: glycosyltransferase, partial [Bacteroidia bacterium]|nr:glycosyltransferase [Bacteroidia bacterium]
EVIPFGIDLERFRPFREESPFKPGTFVIGTIKALEPEYGVDLLIKVFNIVRERHPDCQLKLLIVGGGRLEQELKCLTVSLGISEDVVFQGKVPHNEVPAYFNMLDLFVALSRTESFGVSVLEAAACEKPVIVSDVGGLPEVVENGKTGLVVPDNDLDAAVAAVEKLMTDSELAAAMGKNGRHRVADNYDWNDSVASMISLYQQLVQPKILFLTQYYPPEVGAPQNRLSELAIRFRRAGHEVEVLTAMPNYPFMKMFDGYHGRWYIREEMDGIIIHRSAIFVRQSQSIVVRLMSYFSFVFSSIWVGLFNLKRFDLIICESPPLFLGISAWVLKKFKGAKLLFNVSDLWPESAEKLGLVTNRFFLRISTSLEEFLYSHSDLISGQTQGIVRNISSRIPQKPVFWLKNGVDLSFYSPGKGKPGWREELGYKKEDFIVFYGGILGHAQGLEVILKAALELSYDPSLKFVIAGEGPLKRELMDQAKQMELSNITFLPAYPKSQMPDVIREIDLSIIPLRKLDLFKGAIPSKIFESLAMGKPILLGVEGEAKALFIDDGRCGIAFTPEDATSLMEAIRKLHSDKVLYNELSENAYIYVSKNFNRDKIFIDFQQFIQLHLHATEKP